MSVLHSRYTAEETAHRGDEIYERQIRTLVEANYLGEIVAIDIETGGYTVAETALAASSLLKAEYPEAEIWFVRVGQRALHRIGLQ